MTQRAFGSGIIIVITLNSSGPSAETFEREEKSPCVQNGKILSTKNGLPRSLTPFSYTKSKLSMKQLSITRRPIGVDFSRSYLVARVRNIESVN
jgi:hypothetical protein